MTWIYIYDSWVTIKIAVGSFGTNLEEIFDLLSEFSPHMYLF